MTCVTNDGLFERKWSCRPVGIGETRHVSKGARHDGLQAALKGGPYTGCRRMARRESGRINEDTRHGVLMGRQELVVSGPPGMAVPQGLLAREDFGWLRCVYWDQRGIDQGQGFFDDVEALA